MKKIIFILTISVLILISSCANQQIKEIKTVRDYERSIDYRCNIDSDCEIKNVNKCCGYFTECVNKNTEIDENLIIKLCLQESKFPVCAFYKINQCGCARNKCTGYYDPKLEPSN